jgi:hypothetical protein
MHQQDTSRRLSVCTQKNNVIQVQGTDTNLYVQITGICLLTNYNYPTKVAENTHVLENVCDVVDPNVEDVQYH